MCKFTSLTKISSDSKNSVRNSCCAIGNPLIFLYCYIWFCAFPQSIDTFKVENHWKRTIFRKSFGIIDKKTEISYNSKVCCVPLVSIRYTGVYHGETGTPTRTCRYLPASCIRREVFHESKTVRSGRHAYFQHVRHCHGPVLCLCDHRHRLSAGQDQHQGRFTGNRCHLSGGSGRWPLQGRGIRRQRHCRMDR